MRKLAAIGGYVLLVVLVASVVADHLTAPQNDRAAFDHQQFLVSQIIDGDTIRISPDTTVRLIGIDAPEGDAYWADRATAYIAARALGKTVTLRLEPIETRDRYGRLLAYVYLSDVDCLNLSLIRDGQAFADRRFKHAYRSQYEMAENQTRKKGTGLWKDLAEDQMPPWRRQWLRARESR